MNLSGGPPYKTILTQLCSLIEKDPVLGLFRAAPRSKETLNRFRRPRNSRSILILTLGIAVDITMWIPRNNCRISITKRRLPIGYNYASWVEFEAARCRWNTPSSSPRGYAAPGNRFVYCGTLNKITSCRTTQPQRYHDPQSGSAVGGEGRTCRQMYIVPHCRHI